CSSQLARRHGRPLPISGKMTDVPCHSWVWPTLLSHAGIKFLHLGCNGTSAYVRVPLGPSRKSPAVSVWV
ncbi:MAG: hypothetical protein NT049_18440, partial [Planctomycetota bacterium]|nr:hypothetical protein [Planctomycetota bacterium]